MCVPSRERELRPSWGRKKTAPFFYDFSFPFYIKIRKNVPCIDKSYPSKYYDCSVLWMYSNQFCDNVVLLMEMIHSSSGIDRVHYSC